MNGRRLRRLLVLAAFASVVAGCGGGSGGDGAPLPSIVPDTVDVTVDRDLLASSLLLSDETFAADDCAVEEGATEAGPRRLLRFHTLIANRGALPLSFGDPTAPNPPLTAADFEYAPCHQHHHFEGWADYRIETLDGAFVVAGHKQAFCLLDTVAVVFGVPSMNFDCDYQGLSSGWGDLYDRTLDGQWVDVTGVPAGDYVLVVEVNVAGKVVEADDRWPNEARVTVRLPDPGAPLP